MISIGGGTSCCGGETSISSIASAPLTCISNWSREKSKTDGCCEETQRGGIRGTSDDNYSVETTLVEGLQQSFGEPRFNDKIFSSYEKSGRVLRNGSKTDISYPCVELYQKATF